MHQTFSLALAITFRAGPKLEKSIFEYTNNELTKKGEQFFAGTTSLIAVGLVTWMVFWMKRAARGLREELHGKVATALTTGSYARAIPFIDMFCFKYIQMQAAKTFVANYYCLLYVYSTTLEYIYLLHSLDTANSLSIHI